MHYGWSRPTAHIRFKLELAERGTNVTKWIEANIATPKKYFFDQPFGAVHSPFPHPETVGRLIDDVIQEFLRLQAEAMSEIANDYMQEGAKLLALFGEASRNGAEEVSRAASAARRSAA